MKKWILLMAVGVVLLVAPSFAWAQPNIPPQPQITADCTHFSLVITGYSVTPDNPTPNAVSLVIDGVPFGAMRFGEGFTYGWNWGNFHHSWSVQIQSPGQDDVWADGEACLPKVDSEPPLSEVPLTTSPETRNIPNDWPQRSTTIPTSTVGSIDSAATASATATRVSIDPTSTDLVPATRGTQVALPPDPDDVCLPSGTKSHSVTPCTPDSSVVPTLSYLPATGSHTTAHLVFAAGLVLGGLGVIRITRRA